MFSLPAIVAETYRYVVGVDTQPRPTAARDCPRFG